MPSNTDNYVLETCFFCLSDSIIKFQYAACDKHVTNTNQYSEITPPILVVNCHNNYIQNYHPKK